MTPRNSAGIQYFGIFLPKREQQKLRAAVPPLFRQKSGDHLTLLYDPTDEQLAKLSKQIGKKVVLTLTHEFANERVQAVTPKKGSVRRLDGKVPHITLSWNDGASPAESNDLVKQSPKNAIQPWIRVQGVYDTYPRTLDESLTETQRAVLLYQEDMTQRQSMSLVRWLSAQAKRAGIAQHVYVVGGAVRNFVIGQPIKDIDVTLDVVALRGKKISDSESFAKFLQQQIPARTNLVVNQYGVAILTVAAPWKLDGHEMKGQQIEIANTRTEKYGGEAGKGYKPDEVSPANIDQDILRREFTFNTLLWRLADLAKGPDQAEIIDLTGRGLRDLRAREMRTPIDPDKTFSDDPTRMLRAIKFAVKYGMSLPKDMAASIQRNAAKIQQPPAQAIIDLFNDYVLKGRPRNVRKILDYMVNLGLVDQIRERAKREKLFKTMLQNKLKGKDAKTLLHVLGLGLEVKTDLSFLTRQQQNTLRTYARRMKADDLAKLVAVLKKPLSGQANKRFISQHKLRHAQAKLPTDLARDYLLADPRLATRMDELERRVAAQLKQRLGEARMTDMNMTEMLRLAQGGTVSGRAKLVIRQSDLDVNAGDMMQEKLARQRLIEEMNRQQAVDVRPFSEADLPKDVVLSEMDQSQVKDIMKSLHRRVTKRAKNRRAAEMRNLGAAAMRSLDALSNAETQEEGEGQTKPKHANYTDKPGEFADTETLKQTQDMRKADDDSQDAGAMKRNKQAGNDRGKKDPIGEALAAFRFNRAVAEGRTDAGTMLNTDHVTKLKHRPAGESGSTSMDPMSKGKGKKSNAMKDAPNLPGCGRKDPIGEADADFDNDGDVDEKDKKFTRNINSKKFKARVGDPEDEKEPKAEGVDPHLAEAKAKLSSILRSMNKKNAPPGGWSEKDRVKPVKKESDLEEAKPRGAHDMMRGVKKVKAPNVRSTQQRAAALQHQGVSRMDPDAVKRGRRLGTGASQARLGERPGMSRGAEGAARRGGASKGGRKAVLRAIKHSKKARTASAYREDEDLLEARAAYADKMRRVASVHQGGKAFDAVWSKDNEMTNRVADMRKDKTPLTHKSGGAKAC